MTSKIVVNNIEADAGVSTVTVSDDVSIADKIVHTGDTNTAIRFPAADTITAETGGSERLRIDSSGHMGLGTNNPTDTGGYGRALDITGGASGAAIYLRSANGDTGQIALGSGDLTIRTRQADPIIFNTNNAERLRIDTSGHMGLGITPSDVDSIGRALNIASSTGGAIYLQDTDSPTGKFAAISYNGVSAALQIHAHHSASYIDLGTNGTERLRIDSDGKIFVANEADTIDTTTRLGEGNRFQLSGLSSNDGISVVRYNSSYGAWGFNLGRSRSGTLGTNTILANGDDIGHITFWGADGSDFNQAAQISAQVDGTPSDGTDMPGRLVFKTSADGSGTPSERLRIGSSGQIGIAGANYGSSGQVLTSAGSGSAVTWATPAVTGFTNDTNNRVLTATGSSGINGESTLTFDGNQLYINCGNYSYPLLVNSVQSSVRAAIRQTNDANANSGLAIQKKHSTLHPANYWYGDISFEGWDGSGYHKAGLIECVAEGTPANDNMPGMLRFSTNSGGTSPTERVRITSSGQLRLMNGNSVKMSFYNDPSGNLNHITSNTGQEIKVSSGNGNSNGIEFWDYTGTNKRCQIDGHGIKFNTDTAEANALNDYEEGSWTPTVQYSTSYSAQSGHYTKIGRMVYAYFNVGWYSSSGSHQYITNLPFTSKNDSGGNGGVAKGYQNYDIENGPIYHVDENSTKIYFYKNNGQAFAASNGNGLNFRGVAIYHIA